MGWGRADIDVWFWHSDQDRGVATPLVESFTVAGFPLSAWTGRPSETPGLIFLRSLSPTECEIIRFASNGGQTPVLVIAMENDWQAEATSLALSHGALDVLSVRECEEDLYPTVAARIEHIHEAQVAVLEQQQQGHCIGSSKTWRQLLATIVQSTCRAPLPVHLTGESGTGKEGIARLIHRVDKRIDKRSLVIVDCATLNRELAGSELFGHLKGAFTGALGDREGALALADKGTLFLDEIGELPLPLQGELLRALQERTYKPLGANAHRHSDFRLVSATNRDLKKEVAEGRFRADLYYRLISGTHFHLPRLDDRREDIVDLARHFIAEILGTQAALPKLSAEVAELLKNRCYPGNIRELKGVVCRMLASYCGKGPLTIGLIPQADRLQSHGTQNSWMSVQFDQSIAFAIEAGVPMKEIGKQAEEAAIRHAVVREAGNLQRAASRLQITDRALQLRVAAKRTLAESRSGEPTGSSPSEAASVN